jgi:hypothetical protein
MRRAGGCEYVHHKGKIRLASGIDFFDHYVARKIALPVRFAQVKEEFGRSPKGDTAQNAQVARSPNQREKLNHSPRIEQAQRIQRLLDRPHHRQRHR